MLLLPEKLVLRCRSFLRRNRSASEEMKSVSAAKGFFSARLMPFSQIMLCPEKTMSCVDSPPPALAYT